jgi:hypothetical protein
MWERLYNLIEIYENFSLAMVKNKLLNIIIQFFFDWVAGKDKYTK